MARASTAGCAAALNGMDGTGALNLMGFVSLHVGDPLLTGAQENAAAGGYARQACTWAAANVGAGTKTNTTALSFSTLGTIAVTYFGTWSTVTAGTYCIGGPLASSVTAATITIAGGGITLTAT